MLKGSVVFVKDLSLQEKDNMFELMSCYYENTKKENFIFDLSKKYQVILLKDDDTDNIKGFSTLVLYNMTIDNQNIKLLFSGDTVIDKEYWSNNNLMQVWIKNAIDLKQKSSEKLYWLLISKGYKTYKYLSTMYNEYYPCYSKNTPEFEQKIIDKFGEIFYPNNYDKEKGLIIMNKSKDYLKEEFSKIPQSKLKDPNINFFALKNPEFYNGNELVCITELSVDNLNKSGRRMLGI